MLNTVYGRVSSACGLDAHGGLTLGLEFLRQVVSAIHVTLTRPRLMAGLKIDNYPFWLVATLNAHCAKAAVSGTLGLVEQ